MDISNNIEAYKKQVNELKKFKTIVEQVSNHVVITDVDGKISYANHAAEIITGYKLNEMIGKTPSLWG